MMARDNSIKYMGTATQIFLVLNVLIMFCGNTKLLNVAPNMMIAAFVCLFLNAKVKGFSRNAYSIIQRKENIFIILLGLFTLFIGWQYLTVGFDKNVVFVYFIRYVIYTALLFFVPKPNVGDKMISLEKAYGTICGISYLLMVPFKGASIGGLLGNYQAVGMMMSITAFIYMIDYFEKENDWTKRKNLLGFIFCVLCVFVTGKRTFSMLAVLSFVLVFVFTKKKDKLKDFIKIGITAAAGIAIAYICFEPVRNLADRLIFADYTDQYTFSSGRNILWAMALDVFRGHKLTGIGFGCFPQYTARYYAGNSHAGKWHPHNIYYGLLSNVGIIGTTLFLAFVIVALIYTIYTMRKMYRTQTTELKRIMMYSLMMQLWFVIYGYSGNAIFDANEMYFYVMAIALTLSASVYINKLEIHTKIRDAKKETC